MSQDTDRDALTLDGIGDHPLEAAELRELRRMLLAWRRAGWLKRTGWKWLLGAAVLAGMLERTGNWVVKHLSFHP